LGATAGSIVGLVSKDFIGLVVLSISISTVLTYFIIRQWIVRYVFRIELGVELFLLPAMFIIVLSMLTIAARAVSAALTNPVRSLKDD
jgi:putative ABC transport system permease protein